MLMMKKKFRAKNFPDYTTAKGQLVLDEEGALAIKMHLYRDNPNLYDISFAELLDKFLDKPVLLELFHDPVDAENYSGYHGTLIQNGTQLVLQSDMESKDIGELLSANMNQSIELIVLKVLDEDVENKALGDFEIIIRENAAQ